MPGFDARLTVWEGQESDQGSEKERTKRWVKNLQSAIAEAVKGTEWRFHRWKKHKSSSAKTYIFEIYLLHPEVKSPQDASAKTYELCTRMLKSSLNVELQLLDILDSFTFSPSQEGVMNSFDKAFARHFSVALVESYCIGETLSQELEEVRQKFYSRNTTKYLHYPMISIYDAASLSDSYSHHIDRISDIVEELNGGSVQVVGKAMVDGAKSMVKTVNSNGAGMSLEAKLKLLVASAIQLMRAFKAFAPNIKKELSPKLDILNARVLEGRLLLASKAYLAASSGPIASLNRLSSLDSPSAEDLLITITTFGKLMQTALPLFTVTLAVSDAEFAVISALSIAAGAGLTASLGAGGYILSAGAATVGSAAIAATGGIVAAGFGIGAIVKGVQWSMRQKTDPSITLLAIQKSLEECSRYLLGLLFMAADESKDKDHTHLDRIQALREQLSSDNFAKPGYMKAYYKNISKKLENDMRHLRVGLERYQSELRAKKGTRLRPAV